MAQGCRIAARVLFIAALVSDCHSSMAGRLLVVVSPLCRSHLMAWRAIVAELTEERGHTVVYLAARPDAEKLQALGAPVISYNILGIDHSLPVPEIRITAKTPYKEWLGGIDTLFIHACNGLMSDASALAKVQAFNAELMLGEMFYTCTALVAHKLDLHWVNYWAIAPSFWERLRNVISYWQYIWADIQLHQSSTTKLYRSYAFDPDLPEERARLLLTMVPVHWAGEWLHPVPPNFKLIGPVLARPGHALPSDLEAFLDGAGEQGVLLASLGTIAKLEQGQLLSMASALAMCPCRVLWRLSSSEIPDAAAVTALHLGNNTKVVTWLPQNDVLAHPNLRAFLSHVGINSMYEAIYHGKPVLAVPFFGDQLSNADRVVAKGFGLQVSPFDIATPKFGESLTAVLTDCRFTEAAKGLSTIIRARKNTPVQEAADWIEHMLEIEGVPYMKTPEDQMSIVARSLVDVYAVIALCLCMAMIVGWRLLLVTLTSILHRMSLASCLWSVPKLKKM